MLRLFVGLPLPEDIKSHVVSHSDPVKSLPGLRWISPAALHITLKFLGPVEDKNISKIQSVLVNEVARHRPLRLSLEGGNVLPGRRDPRIFYVALAGDVEGLAALAASIEGEMAPLGFAPESRKFKPHITLARSTAEKGLPGPITDQFCTLFSRYSSPSFLINEVHLIRSHLNPRGSRYETLRSFPLQAL